MIRVSTTQKGNSLLEYLPKTSWYFHSNLVVDYEINGTVGVLFLSLCFHICKPEYISRRLVRCLNRYRTRILLLQADTKNYEICIEEMFSISFKYDFALVLSFSPDESSRYIWALDINCHSTVESLIKRGDDPYTNFLAAFPKINKKNVESLKASFRSIRSLVNTDSKGLESVKGIGSTKASLLKKYFLMAFKDET